MKIDKQLPIDCRKHIADRAAQFVAHGVLDGCSAEECAVCVHLRDTMAELLTQTANALKGPPREMHQHTWSNLPEIAAQVVTYVCVPEGWRIVPVEPTLEMLQSGGRSHAASSKLWRAMLSMAPTPWKDSAHGK